MLQLLSSMSMLLFINKINDSGFLRRYFRIMETPNAEEISLKESGQF
jgi:hypothetical protein